MPGVICELASPKGLDWRRPQSPVKPHSWRQSTAITGSVARSVPGAGCRLLVVGAEPGDAGREMPVEYPGDGIPADVPDDPQAGTGCVAKQSRR